MVIEKPRREKNRLGTIPNAPQRAWKDCHMQTKTPT
jgi:hypothetical protein